MISTNTITNAVNFYENKIQTEKKSETALKMKEQIIKGSKTRENEEKLSEDAKKLLDKLRKKYSDFDFMVAAKGDNRQAMLKGSKKEFSIIFSDEELEKMAQDEGYAKEKIRTMETAVEMSRRINKQFGLLPTGENKEIKDQMINKIGISFNEDGTMSLFAEVEKVSESQRNYLEKLKAKRAEEKEETKKAEEKKATLKEKEVSIKKVTLEASSEEELVEKLQKVEWNKVVGKSVGTRFDLTI